MRARPGALLVYHNAWRVVPRRRASEPARVIEGRGTRASARDGVEPPRECRSATKHHHRCQAVSDRSRKRARHSQFDHSVRNRGQSLAHHRELTGWQPPAPRRHVRARGRTPGRVSSCVLQHRVPHGSAHRPLPWNPGIDASPAAAPRRVECKSRFRRHSRRRRCASPWTLDLPPFGRRPGDRKHGQSFAAV